MLWFTPAELAERWKVSPDAVLDMARRGEIGYKRVGRLYRFASIDVESWENNRDAAESSRRIRVLRKQSRLRAPLSGPDEFADL